jgi:mercuric transport protein
MMKTVLYGVIGAGTFGFFSICDLYKPLDEAAPAATATVALVAGLAPSAQRQAAQASAETQSEQTVTLDVQGMDCAGCVIGVRTVLKRLPGVSKAEVTYETRRAVVTYDPAKVTVAQMIAAIKTLKYTATVVTS